MRDIATVGLSGFCKSSTWSWLIPIIIIFSIDATQDWSNATLSPRSGRDLVGDLNSSFVDLNSYLRPTSPTFNKRGAYRAASLRRIKRRKFSLQEELDNEENIDRIRVAMYNEPSVCIASGGGPPGTSPAS
jgi:hypothetical protein